MKLNPFDRCVCLSGVAAIACAVVLSGCQQMQPYLDQLSQLTNSVPQVTPTATNALPPIVVTPQPTEHATGALVPVKIAHGQPESLRSAETPDSSSERTVDGMAFRIYELDSDKPIGRQAVNAKAIRVNDGMTVIDDFLLDSGQVAVWEYSNDGRDKGQVVRDNPAKLRNDTRIRYRCYARAK